MHYVEEIRQLKYMLVGFFSHHIRTPLNTTFMGLQLLEKEILTTECSGSEKLLNFIDEIKTSSKQADDILQDLITYEKIESNRMIIHTEQFHIIPFLEHIFDRYSHMARRDRVTFITDLHPIISTGESDVVTHTSLNNVMVIADKVQFTRVVNIVIENAFISAGRGGYVTVKVHPGKTIETAHMLKIEVEDSGVCTTKVCNNMIKYAMA